MSEPTDKNPRRQVLEAECLVLCQYLTGKSPTDYARACYVEAHTPCSSDGGGSFTDTLLIHMARLGPRPTALADAYAAAFARHSALRKKLILLLAILESAAPTDAWVDSVTATSRFGFLVRTVWGVAGFVLKALAAAIVVLPLALVYRLSAPLRRASSDASP